MYTNAGVLAMLKPVDVSKNLVRIEKLLEQVEKGKLVITGQEFDELVRWEQDMRTYFVQKAEQTGLTNIHRHEMGSF